MTQYSMPLLRILQSIATFGATLILTGTACAQRPCCWDLSSVRFWWNISAGR